MSKIQCKVLSSQAINYKDKSGQPQTMYKHEVFIPEFPAIIPVMGNTATKPGDYSLDIVLTRDRQSFTVQLPA